MSQKYTAVAPKYIICSSILLLAFCVFNAKAETLYGQNTTTPYASDRYGIGTTEGSTGQGFDRDALIWQRLGLQGTVNIGKIRLEGCQHTPADNMDYRFFFASTTHALNEIIADHNKLSTHTVGTEEVKENFAFSATCNPKSTSTWSFMEIDFSTPHVHSTSTPIEYLIIATNQGGGVPLDSGIFRVNNNSIPFGIPAPVSLLYSGGASTISNANFANYGDLSMELYQDNSELYIDTPVQYETVTGTFNIGGRCQTSSNVDLNIIYDENLATTTIDFVITDIPCTSNSWSFEVTGGLEPEGDWYVVATDNYGGYDTVDFTFDQTFVPEVPPVVLNWSCNISYLSFDPCATFADMVENIIGGIWNIVRGLGNTLTSSRPLGYVKEIVSAVKTANDTASTTDYLIPQARFYVPTTTAFTNTGYRFDMNFFSADTFTNVLPQSSWDSIRPYMNLVFYLIFGFYLFRRIKRLV